MSKYITQIPSSSTRVYNSSVQLPLVLNIQPGMELIKGSIRISGKLKVEKTAGVVLEVDDVHWDSQTGIHSVISTIETRFNRVGERGESQVEYNPYYSRWVHMVNESQTHFYNQCFNNNKSQELITGVDYSAKIWKGEATGVDNANPPNPEYNGELSFCLAPMISANNTLENIRSDSVEYIKLILTFKDPSNVFWVPGGALPGGFKYGLSDIRVHYMVQPLDTTIKPNQPTQFIKIDCVQSDFSSTVANLNFRPTNPVISMVSTFINKDATELRDDCEFVEDLNRVEYFINGQSSQMHFPLTDTHEMAMNYIRAMNYETAGQFTESNAIYSNQILSHWGVGLFMNTPLNLAGGSLTLNLQRQNSNKYLFVYNFFVGLGSY